MRRQEGNFTERGGVATESTQGLVEVQRLEAESGGSPLQRARRLAGSGQGGCDVWLCARRSGCVGLAHRRARGYPIYFYFVISFILDSVSIYSSGLPRKFQIKIILEKLMLKIT